MREEGESLGVFEPKGAIAVTDRPILAVFAEDPFLRRADPGPRIGI
jgi:hypothetical protein